MDKERKDRKAFFGDQMRSLNKAEVGPEPLPDQNRQDKVLEPLWNFIGQS